MQGFVPLSGFYEDSGDEERLFLALRSESRCLEVVGAKVSLAVLEPLNRVAAFHHEGAAGAALTAAAFTDEQTGKSTVKIWIRE